MSDNVSQVKKANLLTDQKSTTLKRLRLPSVGKEVENLRKSMLKEKEKSATKSQKNDADGGQKYKKPSIRGKLN